jgi:NADPH-dependent 2,4-dienoyl-CoA reductase/sulfur reductase-like enzyme
MVRKILIVGGVGGGATVAAQIRREDRNAEIVLFDKGSHISFSNCGMPYYIGDVVEKRSHLLFPETKFSKKYNVDVRTDTEVISIDRDKKQITCKTESNTYAEGYDTLILAPGASAVMPDIKGIDNDKTFPLHTIPDMDDIYSYIKNNSPKTVAITGAGFIGLEMAENLHKLGLKCTIIDRSAQVFKAVDSDLAAHVQTHLEEKGVQVHLNDGIAAFSDNGTTLHLTSDKTVHSDLNIMAVGIKPNTSLAIDAFLTLGSTGAIKVNEYMQTADPNIYALGDAVETRDLVMDTARSIALASPAHRQAYIIASHLNNKAVPYKGTLGTSIIKLFDLSVGATGHNRTSLNKQGVTYREASLEAYSHARYFPGSDKLWLKILFDEKTGTIYGGQAAGFDGVDKRLAVLATAIHAKLTVADLPELELGYAPPYSTPKDPINVLGYKAAAKLDN